MIAVTVIENSLLFAVRVIPRSAQTSIVGEHQGSLKIRVSSPPIDGAANEAVIKLLAKTFRLAKTSIIVHAGERSRSKVIRVEALDRHTAYDLAALIQSL